MLAPEPFKLSCNGAPRRVLARGPRHARKVVDSFGVGLGTVSISQIPQMNHLEKETAGNVYYRRTGNNGVHLNWIGICVCKYLAILIQNPGQKDWNSNLSRAVIK